LRPRMNYSLSILELYHIIFAKSSFYAAIFAAARKLFFKLLRNRENHVRFLPQPLLLNRFKKLAFQPNMGSETSFCASIIPAI
jgi:hypothetical protein